MRSAKKRIASTSSASLAVSDVVDVAADDREGELAERLGLRAVGDRLRHVDVHDRSPLRNDCWPSLPASGSTP